MATVTKKTERGTFRMSGDRRAEKALRRNLLQAAPAPSYAEIPIMEVQLASEDLRRNCSKEEIDRMAASLKLHGMIEPIVVRPLADGGYEVVAGGRRLRAAKVAGFECVPACIRKQMGLAEARILAIVENLERKDLDPIERARGLQRLCAPLGDGGAGMSQPQVAEKFGHDQSWVSNTMRLLELPEVWQTRVASGEVSAASARELLAFKASTATLGAIDRDYREDPGPYQTWRGFRRQVELFVKNHPSVNRPARWRESPDNSCHTERELAESSEGPAVSAQQSVSGYGHQMAKSPGAISTASSEPVPDTEKLSLIVAQVMSLRSERELLEVETAIAERRKQLADALSE